MTYAPFTKKQAVYIEKATDCWLNVLEGGKRAGKNLTNIIAFARTVDGHRDKIHLAAGVSIAAAKMNILDSNGFGLANYFRGRARTGLYNGKNALFVQSKRGEKVIVFVGGGRSGDAAFIKGNSYGAVYMTEANELDREFFFEVLDRTVASSDRKVFLDLNPKAQGHWFYKQFLDFHDEKKTAGYQYMHMTVADNLSIPDERLTEILSTYDKQSVWYQSEILGKRVAATGRIYEAFGNPHIVRAHELHERRIVWDLFSIGVDVGGTDATVATLVGFANGFQDVYVLDGYYHKQGQANGYTHERYAEEIAEKVADWAEEYPQLYESGVVFCEAADKLFRQALAVKLMQKGTAIRVVPSYKKDGILARIRLLTMLIAGKRLFVLEHLTHWITAFSDAVWSDNDRAQGKWVRLDNNSYPLDCLDSTEYAIEPFKGKILH